MTSPSAPSDTAPIRGGVRSSLNEWLRLPSQPAVVGIGSLVAVAAVVAVQLIHLDELLDKERGFTAGHAEGLVLTYTLAAVAIAVAAVALPGRWRWIPVAAAGAAALVALSATLLLGGELWSFLWASLTMAACWRAGNWLLPLVGAQGLARLVPVAWLAGVGVLGIGLLLIGRIGLLYWWTVGAATLLLGALGMVGLARMLGADGALAAWAAVTRTPLAAASAAVCLLLLGLASVWAAAPELTFDALYYKAWLPSEWARTGEIAPLTLHPYLNVAGLSQLIAVPGHLAGAEGVGRYLQWLAQGAMVAAVWWTARRSWWAPAAAAALAATPLLFWEATTALEDAILALAGVSLAVGVLSALKEPKGSVVAIGGTLGALAGICIGLKLHLAPLALALVVGWLLMRGRDRWAGAGVSASVGALIAIAPPMILRWIDVGNPVMPFLNDVFNSPYWPTSAGINLPLGPVAAAALILGAILMALVWGRERAARLGLAGLVLLAVLISLSAPSLITDSLKLPPSNDPATLLADTVTDSARFASVQAIGGLGLLGVAIALAVIVCWRRAPGESGVPAIWLGVVVAAAVWCTQFLDARYLLPTGAVAVLALALSTGRRSPGRRLELAGLVALLATALVLWPATIAQIPGVPGGGIPWRAALGLIDDREYERQATAARELLSAFNRVAPPEALAVGDAHQRTWLTEGRDLVLFSELDLKLKREGRALVDPAATLLATQEAGVHWVLTLTPELPGEGLSGHPAFERMVAVYGRPVASNPSGTLYELPGGPR